MMRLPGFEYLAPTSLSDACRALADDPGGTRVVAGGTDLWPNMKRRHQQARRVVALRRVSGMRGVQHGSGECRLGAMTTLSDILRDEGLRSAVPGFVQAVGSISTPVLRNMGTIGGNLALDTRCTYYDQSYHWRKAINFCMKKDGEVCWVAPGSPRCWAVSSSDTAPVFVALGARVRLVGPEGERVIPVRELYGRDGINFLAGKRPDEIITDILLPPAEGWESVYLKLRRRGSFDFPILGVAVALRRNEDGTVADARIVLGAVESYPLEVPDAAALLVGNRLEPEVIEAAAKACFKPARPLDNTDLTLYYRKKMVPVYVARALRQLAGQPSDQARTA